MFTKNQVPNLVAPNVSTKPYLNFKAMSCCGNILWFEKCNTSEYAAGGHRPTRSDAAKLMNNTTTIRNIFGLRIHIISTELQVSSIGQSLSVCPCVHRWSFTRMAIAPSTLSFPSNFLDNVRLGKTYHPVLPNFKLISTSDLSL
ncbi:unnamed protein product [Nesidiocoris tenuis]|uniref:Uncharacterized protein n=1 Tax=Nesidiocoris tenuis TaxID=355587 RepID=A0A6H5H5H6_9HEMI|nr:unnamed protein product [Nesidiocoris tenuis]